MPTVLASSVDIISTERAQRMQRKVLTKASGCGAAIPTVGQEQPLRGSLFASPAFEGKESEEQEDDEDPTRWFGGRLAIKA